MFLSVRRMVGHIFLVRRVLLGLEKTGAWGGGGGGGTAREELSLGRNVLLPFKGVDTFVTVLRTWGYHKELGEQFIIFRCNRNKKRVNI